MDRKVPVSPVHVQRLRVPPVLVEEAVSESQQLSGEVQPRVEHSVEHEQPDAGVGHCKLEESLQQVDVAVDTR